ncbi:MAG: nuclear transport factor 2 family protein [Candidatus Lokiarchaeia archaeon]
MSNKKTLTDEEKRNLDVVKEWAKTWSTHGAATRMVDEIYADSCEVFTPLQNIHYVKKGQSKENWKNVEIAVEKIFEKREMRLLQTLARGDTVAVEAEITLTPVQGETIKSWFAAFLTLKDGRIIKDHTYMRDLPREYLTPELRDAVVKILKNL